MLNFYTNKHSTTYDKWKGSAYQPAIAMGKGQYCVWQLCKLSRQYIEDWKVLPINPYGTWNKSMLADKDLAADVRLFLQELGPKKITTEKLVNYLSQWEIMEKYEITKKITTRTAQNYLQSLGYWWSQPKKGQYADGHERGDVVAYHEKVLCHGGRHSKFGCKPGPKMVNQRLDHLSGNKW
jgi:hypothetical protein